MLLESAAEWNLFLQDWGTSVEHLSVLSTYDPVRQTLTESVESRPLTVIVGPLSRTVALGVEPPADEGQRQMVCALADWPELEPGHLRRLVHDGVTYDVLSFTRLELAGMGCVLCRQRG